MTDTTTDDRVDPDRYALFLKSPKTAVLWWNRDEAAVFGLFAYLGDDAEPPDEGTRTRLIERLATRPDLLGAYHAIAPYVAQLKMARWDGYRTRPAQSVLDRLMDDYAIGEMGWEI